MKTAVLDEVVKIRDAQTLTVERELGKHFKSVEAYRKRFTDVIRIRIIDESFSGQPYERREDRVFPLIEQLPKEIQDDITFLLLSTPTERKKKSMSQLNDAFENPIPAHPVEAL